MIAHDVIHVAYATKFGECVKNAFASWLRLIYHCGLRMGDKAEP
jgi:hypothetical protein